MTDYATARRIKPECQCSVARCNRQGVVSMHHGDFLRCARHYMIEVDKLGKSATSKIFNERFADEMAEMEDIGLEVYKVEALQRMKLFAKAFSKQH